MSQTVMPFIINEKTTGKMTWDFIDEHDDLITNVMLATLTLTLYDECSGTIINSRNNQDILGSLKTGINNVSILPNAQTTWILQITDNIIVGTDVPLGATEEHIALVRWTWVPLALDLRAGSKEIRIKVKNLNKVT